MVVVVVGIVDFGLEVNGSGEVVVHNNTGVPIPKLSEDTIKLPLGMWCHIILILSFDRSLFSIYCDGELLATVPCTGVSKLASGFASTLFVAGRPVDGADSGGGEIVDGMIGSVAEVRLWSRPRSHEEIVVGRGRHALQGTEGDLLGCWRVDEGAGHIIHDCR